MRTGLLSAHVDKVPGWLEAAALDTLVPNAALRAVDAMSPSI
jgi:hypothetical protein